MEHVLVEMSYDELWTKMEEKEHHRKRRFRSYKKRKKRHYIKQLKEQEEFIPKLHLLQ